MIGRIRAYLARRFGAERVYPARALESVLGALEEAREA